MSTLMWGEGVKISGKIEDFIYGHQPNTCFYFRSAFFWFAADERPKVRAANPNFAVGDIAKELGKRWSEFGPTFKQKYEAKAEKDRERYVNAKQDFQQMLKDEKNGMGLFCLLMIFISSTTTV